MANAMDGEAFQEFVRAIQEDLMPGFALQADMRAARDGKKAVLVH